MRGGLGPSSALLPWEGAPPLHPGLLLYDARGYAPLHSPRGGRSAPPTPGDFPVAGKVTKGAPRAVPFGILRCVVAALFALAALRSVSRRATFYYKPRPICHFKLVGKSVFFLPKLHRGSHPLLSIRGAAGGLCSLRAARSFSPFWGEQRLRCWGDDNAPQGGPGVPPGESLVTFFSKKSHPGWRGGAPPHGRSAEEGPSPPRIGVGATVHASGRKKWGPQGASPVALAPCGA